MWLGGALTRSKQGKTGGPMLPGTTFPSLKAPRVALARGQTAEARSPRCGRRPPSQEGPGGRSSAWRYTSTRQLEPRWTRAWLELLRDMRRHGMGTDMQVLMFKGKGRLVPLSKWFDHPECVCLPQESLNHLASRRSLPNHPWDWNSY